MRNKTILIFVILGLTILTILYSLFLININFGVVDYDEYHDNPPCEIKELDNGYTQISNCAKYKLNRDMFSKFSRLRG